MWQVSSELEEEVECRWLRPFNGAAKAPRTKSNAPTRSPLPGKARDIGSGFATGASPDLQLHRARSATADFGRRARARWPVHRFDRLSTGLRAWKCGSRLSACPRRGKRQRGSHDRAVLDWRAPVVGGPVSRHVLHLRQDTVSCRQNNSLVKNGLGKFSRGSPTLGAHFVMHLLV